MEVLTNQELSAIKGGKWVLIDGEWFGLTLILIQIINTSFMLGTMCSKTIGIPRKYQEVLSIRINGNFIRRLCVFYF